MSDSWPDLITAFLDGSLTEEEALRLNAWIKQDSQNVRQFVREAVIHSHLYDLLDGDQAIRREAGWNSPLRSGDCMTLPAVTDLPPLDHQAAAQEELSQGIHGERPPSDAMGHPAGDGMMRSDLPDDSLGLGDEGDVPAEPTSRIDSTEAVFGYRMEPQEEQDVPEELVVPNVVRALTPASTPLSIVQTIFKFRAWFVYGAVAAMVLIAMGVWRWYSRSNSPQMLATLDATVDVAWEGSEGHEPVIGSRLAKGQSVRLTRGYVQFTYPTGAKVILQGPAQARLEERDHLTLDWGRLTATIPEPAHGFVVATPTGDVVDLGTEFGVDVSVDQIVKVLVFHGHVKATAAHDAGNALTLAAGQSAQISAGGVVLALDNSSLADFVRDIHQVSEAFTIHGTGQGLEPGSVDPHWTLNLVTADDAHAQVLSSVDPTYVPDNANAQWISVSSQKQNYPSRYYTFTTTFNLAGFDPATAHLTLELSIEGTLDNIRLNGNYFNSGISSLGKRGDPTRKLEVTLDRGFVPGVNQLQLVVGTGGAPGPMALRAGASGEAVRVAQDATTQMSKPAE